MLRHTYLTGERIIMWCRAITKLFACCSGSHRCRHQSHFHPLIVRFLWFCSCSAIVVDVPCRARSFFSICLRSDGDWKWENIAIYLGDAHVLVWAPRAILNPLSRSPTLTSRVFGKVVEEKNRWENSLEDNVGLRIAVCVWVSGMMM